MTQRKRPNKKLSKSVQEEIDDYKSSKLDRTVINEFIKLKDLDFELTNKQKHLVRILKSNSIITVVGPPGTSKAQPLDAKVLTPNGWMLMGDISVGNTVIGVNGNPIKVIGVYPQGKKKIFRIEFSDGSSTECTEEHLWLTWNHSERNYRKKKKGVRFSENHEGTIRTIGEMMGDLTESDGRLKYSIPVVKPIEFKEKDFFLEPYLLGSLIGDGFFGNYIGFSTNDKESYEIINDILSKKNYILSDRKRKGNFVDCAIINKDKKGRNLIKEEISKLGLLYKKSYEKFIPEEYLFGSIKQRVELLQGLMDTDGSASLSGGVSFSTSSEVLKDDFIKLIQSLGGVCKYKKYDTNYTYNGKKINGAPTYKIHINLPNDILSNCFSLKRKQDKVKLRTKYFPTRFITGITEIREDEAQCILVDDENHLYITDDYIVTHNTFISCYAAIQEFLKGKYDKIILCKPTEVLSGTKDPGALPGPQPLSAKILTPNGWTTMGEIKVGDYVCTPDGGSARVLEVYDKGLKDIYEIETNIGKTYACDNHLWLTQTFNENKHKKPFKVRSTKEIIDTLYSETTKRNIGKPNHFLPHHNSIEFEKKELPIPPYVLGCLIGDGSTLNHVTISNNDEEIIDRIREELGSDYSVLKYDDNSINYHISYNSPSKKSARRVKITNSENLELIYETIGEAHSCLNHSINMSTLKSRCENKTSIDNHQYEFLEKTEKWTNKIKNDLEDLSLLGLKSYEKSIPFIYKYTSIEDRLSLLQGLMDTDGTCKKNGEASFCTTSIKLAEDIVEIVKSLGGKSHIQTRNRIGKKSKLNDRVIESKRISYEVYVNLPNNLNPFYLSRKAERFQTKYMHHNRIVNIKKQDEKQYTKCILIDHPEHLYITDDFIVTHNTLDEKMAVYAESFFDAFEEFLDAKDFKHLWDSKAIEFKPAQFLRGRSIKNAFIIIDEFQNFDSKALKSIVTRKGRGSTIVFMGDTRQNDINKKHVAVDVFNQLIEEMGEGCTAFKFERADIVRDPLLIKLMDKWEEYEDKGKWPDTIKGS